MEPTTTPSGAAAQSLESRTAALESRTAALEERVSKLYEIVHLLVESGARGIYKEPGSEQAFTYNVLRMMRDDMTPQEREKWTAVLVGTVRAELDLPATAATHLPTADAPLRETHTATVM